MTTEKILIMGGGGHAKVVIDALSVSSGRAQITLADDNRDKHGTEVLGVIIASTSEALHGATCVHIAIGDNAVRECVSERMGRTGLLQRTVIHPGASVSSFSTLQDGVFVAARAVIGPDTVVARGSIVNHGAIVDHDCRLGEFCHVAPNATLGGAVVLGRRVLIGAGANVLPGVSIGDDCIIGAGAVVLQDVMPGTTYVGVPARKHR